MKVLCKIFIFIILTLLVSCLSNSKKETNNLEVERVTFFNSQINFEFDDGVKIKSNGLENHYYLSVDKPECCQLGESKIILDKIKFKKGVIISEQTIEFNVKEKNLTPKILVNTLTVKDVDNDGKEELFFVYSLRNNIIGIEPITLMYTIFYNGDFYFFETKIPLHEDWDWESNFTLINDKRLKLISKDVYSYAHKTFNEMINNYKINFNNNLSNISHSE